MKPWSIRRIIFAFGFVGILGAGLYIFNYRSPKTNLKGFGGVIKQDLLQRVTIAGGVIPLRKTVITAPYNGYVKKLFVKIGDRVKLGDPLVSVVQSLQSGDNTFPLRSPLNGVVVQVEKAEGEFVKEGESKEFILRIDDISKLYILANAPEIDRVKVKSGQDVVIKASAIPGRTYKGVIRELSLAARDKDQWSRSQLVDFPIKIEMIDPDETIRPGMSVVIDVITAKKEQVLTLRHEFLRRENGKYFVILKDGKRKDVTTGIQNEEGFEILSGVEIGDKIKQVDFAEIISPD